MWAGSRGRYVPVSKNSASTSFSFVATIRLATGSPILFAIHPARTSPKFPVGTANETFSSGESDAASHPLM